MNFLKTCIFFAFNLFLVQADVLIRGKIIDGVSQLPLPQANITVIDTEEGITSDEKGEFTLQLSQTGYYTLRISYIGYESKILNDIWVRPNASDYQQVMLYPSVILMDNVEVTFDYFEGNSLDNYSAIGFKNDQIVFNSKSGVLTVNKSIDGLALDFPIINPELIEIPEWISFIGGDPKEAYLCGDDYLFIYDSEKNVRELKPSFSALKEVKARGFICSSKSNSCDFVSRFFAPRAGINEDPVTGSAHTKLVPYWAGIYKKNNFFARQISVRGGELKCILTGDRVKIQGAVRLYMKGELYL